MPTTITSAGVTFTDTTTLTSANGVPSALKLTTERTINGIAFDGTADITIPASGSSSAKAWVNFDGNSTTTWAGGASTVTRVAASTTATITTTNAHGLTTGNSVYVLTGGVVAGSYNVTVLTSNTFTITTVATTALTGGAITFQVSPIRSQYNVSSVTKRGVGSYTVNFATPMTDLNYAAFFTGSCPTGLGNSSGFQATEETVSYTVFMRTQNKIDIGVGDAGSVLTNALSVSTLIFGN